MPMDDTGQANLSSCHLCFGAGRKTKTLWLLFPRQCSCLECQAVCFPPDHYATGEHTASVQTVHRRSLASQCELQASA